MNATNSGSISIEAGNSFTLNYIVKTSSKESLNRCEKTKSSGNVLTWL